MGAKHIIDELVVLLGFEADTDKATMFKETMKQINDVAKTMAAGMTGVVAGISYFAITTAKSVQENAEFAKSMDISYEAMQRYQYAIGATGGNAESARNDLHLLAFAAKRDGITIQEAAANISAQFEGMNDLEASTIGANLQFSEDTIRLLRKGKEGVRSLFAEADNQGAIIPENAPERAIEFNSALHSLSATIAGIKSTAIISILKPITKVLEAMKHWVAANKELINSGVRAFIQGTIIAFQNVYEVVSDIAKVVLAVARSLGLMSEGMDKVALVAKFMEGALVILAALIGTSFIAAILSTIVPIYTLVAAIVTATTATAAWNAVLKLNPFVLVAIAIVAIAVACYALYRYLSDLYDRSVMFRQIVEGLTFNIRLLIGVVSFLAKNLISMLAFAFETLIPLAKTLFSVLMQWAQTIPIFQAVGLAIDLLIIQPMNIAIEKAKALWEWLMKIPGAKALVKNIGELAGPDERQARSGDRSKLDRLSYLRAPIDRSELPRKVRPTNMNNMNNQNSTVNQTINIHGSKHPSVVGQEVAAATNNALAGSTPGTKWQLGGT